MIKARMVRWEHVPQHACHLCGTALNAAPVVGNSCREGRSQGRVACIECGLVQVAPMPDADTVRAYYESGEYWREHPPVSIRFSDGRIVEPNDPGYEDAVSEMHRVRARTVVSDLGLERFARVAEYGCGDGDLLYELEAIGINAVGVEADTSKHTSTQRGRPVLAKLGSGFEPDAVIAFHVLEHQADPLAWLAEIRGHKAGKVFFEVPDIMQPNEDLEGFHFQWAHLYEFSALTLGSLLYRAGFDEIEVRRGNGVLQAHAVDRGSEAREYRPHGGPNGEQVAAFLETVKQADKRTVVERIVAGELDVGPHTEQLRAELTKVRDGQKRLADAYDELTESIGALSLRCDEDATMRFESWHPDERVNEHAMGEGMGLWTIKATLAHIANAARVKKLRDGAQ